MRKSIGIIGVSLALTACAQTRYVPVEQPLSLQSTPGLQACAEHAATAQKAAFGDEFNGLQLNTRELVITAPSRKVGTQPVGIVYDGQGQWFGVREYRKVRFHCMISPAGQVVYSFVRGE